jgi:hypothetical protein
MTARLVPIEYASGTHHMVECRECLVILNSGHHYPPTATHHAQRLADEHNAEHHGRIEHVDDCSCSTCWDGPS